MSQRSVSSSARSNSFDAPLDPQVLSLFDAMSQKLDDLAVALEQLQSQEPKREFYSVEEAAGLLDLATWTVRTYCRTGRIEAGKLDIGNEWRISHEEIIRYKEHGPAPGYGGYD